MGGEPTKTQGTPTGAEGCPAAPAPGRNCRTALWVGSLVLAVVVFWWPCLFGRMTPLLADAQAHMLPWRADHPPRDRPQWDALLWDSMAQYYPWRTFAARMGRRGLIPLWNPHQFCGTPFIANGQSAFFYPPNWLFLVLDTRYAFGLLAALHYLMAAGFMFLLGRELGLSNGAAAAGAVAFSFGGFMVGWTYLPTLMNSAAWLPAACWAIERSFRRPTLTGPIGLAAALSMTLLAGHLQIAAYVWVVAAVHLGARSLWALGQRLAVRWGSVGVWWRAIVACGAAVMVAIGLAALQVLPTIELARMSSRGAVRLDEAGFRFRVERALKPPMLRTFVSPDSLGTPREWAEAGVPYSETCGYVGRLTLLLMLVGLIGVRSRQSLFYAVLAALALNAAMGGLTAQMAYYCVPGLGQTGGFARALCVYTFAVAVLAALGADRLARWCAGAPASTGFVPRLGPWVGAASTVLIFADLLAWGRGFLPLAPRERVYPETAAVERLRQDAGKWRVLEVTHRDDWTLQRTPEAVLPPNTAMAYGYDSVQGYDSLRPGIYDALAGRVNREGFCPVTNGNMVLLDNVRADVLSRAAVRWVVVRDSEPLRSERYSEVWRGSGVVLYQDPAASPRVRLVTAYVPTAEPEVLSTRFAGDPSRIVCELGLPPERLEIADTFWPGWRAFADGREAPIRFLPPMFRQIALDRGTKHVELVYAPASFRVGAFVSLMSLALIAGSVAFARARVRHG